MKKLLQHHLTTSVLILGILPGILIGAANAAPESDGCFMVDSSGRKIRLDGLCANSRSAPAAAPSANRPVAVINIKRRSGGTPIVDVTFNGRQTFEMIVDTGASGTLITRRMADALGVVEIGRAGSRVADGSRVIFSVGYVQSVTVDKITVKDLPVAIAERMPVGLLGHDFFGDFDVKITRRTIEFYKREPG